MTAVGLAILWAGQQGAAQTRPRTVYDVLAQMPWDAAKDGPLVAPCAMRIANGETLDDLGRKRATVGGLTALVPKTMVTVNSKFTTAPNLYEGLPMDAKVMYLMRTLTPGQWSRATDQGLSIDDLQGEQRLVFDSILPKPFRYGMGKITVHGSIQNPTEYQTLTEAERAKVKLRIIRHLEVEVALENDGGWTGTTIEEDEKPGVEMAFLPDDKDEEFGQTILVRGPNVPRKSQIDLTGPALTRALPLVDRESVKDLVGRVSMATGLKIVADPHYKDMTMLERGTSATAGDLLSALSLGVAGVYRRVGDTYVLTSDLEGIAAHQARIAVWEDALKKEVDARMAKWRDEVANGGGFRKIAFHSKAADGLTPAEQENLEANDGPGQNGPKFIPIGQASKPFAAAIAGWEYGNKIDREKVGVSSSIRYQILLPGVGRTWWQGWLGNTDQFREKPYVWAPPNPKPVTLPLDASKGVADLILRADTPAEARRAVALAARVGVKGVLLETRDASVLRAAIEAGGAEVGLVVRPWALGPGEASADPDRTATGDHGRSLAAAKAAIGPWHQHWQDISAFEPPTRELIAPRDPATSAHIAATAALAATKGLARVAVLDLYPVGYARADSRYSGSYFYSSALDGFLGYGYTSTLRATHLREKGVDPLDLTTDMMSTAVNLNGVWGDTYVFGNLEEWQKARGTWSHERVVALTKALQVAAPSLPLWLPGEPQETHLPPLVMVSLYPWRGGDLPEMPRDFGGGEVPEAAAAQVLEIREDPDPSQANRVAARLAKALAKPGKPLVLDFSAVPSGRLEAVVARWLKKV